MPAGPQGVLAHTTLQGAAQARRACWGMHDPNQLACTAHPVTVHDSVCAQEAFKAREAELMAKSEAAWREYQESRGGQHTALVLSWHRATRTASVAQAKRITVPPQQQLTPSQIKAAGDSQSVS